MRPLIVLNCHVDVLRRNGLGLFAGKGVVG
jgi:hypothetical protein